MSLAARSSLPRARRARGVRGGVLRRLLALGVVVWLIAGVIGVTTYVHRYSLYRGFPPPVTPNGVPTGTVRTLSFFSPALGQSSSAEVYLPAGYSRETAQGRRFGVLYLLHGTPGAAAN